MFCLLADLVERRSELLVGSDEWPWPVLETHWTGFLVGEIIVHVGHGVSDRFAAENFVSGCKTGFGIQSGFLLQLLALNGESKFKLIVR